MKIAGFRDPSNPTFLDNLMKQSLHASINAIVRAKKDRL